MFLMCVPICFILLLSAHVVRFYGGGLLEDNLEAECRAPAQRVIECF